jgi:hypothetical protein
MGGEKRCVLGGSEQLRAQAVHQQYDDPAGRRQRQRGRFADHPHADEDRRQEVGERG